MSAKYVFATILLVPFFFGSFAQSRRYDSLVTVFDSVINTKPTKEILKWYQLNLPNAKTDLLANIEYHEKLASYFNSKGAKNQSIEYNLKAFELYRNNMVNGKYDTLFYTDAFFCATILAVNYFEVQDTLSSNRWLDTCTAISEHTDIDFLRLHAYNNRGYIYKQHGVYDSALVYFNNALNYIGNSYSDSILYGIIIGNIGSANYELGNCSIAAACLKTNMELSRNLGFVSDYIKTSIKYANALYCLRQYKNAHLILEKIRMQVFQDYPKYKSAWLQSKTQLCIALYEDSSTHWFKEFHQHISKQTKETKQTANRVLNELMQEKIELATSAQKIEFLKRDQDRTRDILFIQRILFFVFVVLMLTVYGILVFRKRALRKQKLLESEKLKAEISEKELENTKLRNEKLDMEIDNQSKDITSLSLDIRGKFELQEKWSSWLKKIVKLRDINSLRVELKSLLKDVETTERIEKEKKPLKNQIEDVNARFYAKLKETCPMLTKGELQLCGMLRLGMSNKEISTVRDVTPASVRVLKNRLRKKLHIDGKEDIQAYLENLFDNKSDKL